MPKTSKTSKSKSVQMKEDIQAVPVAEWDWSRVVYSKPIQKETQDGSGNFRRVKIQYMYDDHTIGPAIVSLQRHFSYGVQADNVDKDGNVKKDSMNNPVPLKNYQVPIVMSNLKDDNPVITDEEQMEIDFLDQFREEVTRYAIENKKLIGQGAKKDAHIEAAISNILWRKTLPSGDYDESKSPVFYTKLKYFAKSNVCHTPFYGPGDTEMDPLKVKGSFKITANIHFDNIFINSKTIALQHRIYDATIEPNTSGPQKRLAKKNTLPLADGSDDEDGDGDVGVVPETPAGNRMESDSDDDDDDFSV